MMNFIAISDRHISGIDDPKFKDLTTFLKSKVTEDISAIYFLGDIFDLMAGFHKEYLITYKQFFDELLVLVNRGVAINYIEGNHDMHLEKMFKYFRKKNSVPDNMINIFEYPIYKDVAEKCYYFTHGDELGKNDPTFRRYKKIIKSRVISFVANNIMPLKLLEYIGNKASAKSHKKNHGELTNSDIEQVKGYFRNGIHSVWQNKSFDIAISGHSHVPDSYISEDNYAYHNISTYDDNFYYFDSRKMEVLKFMK